MTDTVLLVEYILNSLERLLSDDIRVLRATCADDALTTDRPCRMGLGKEEAARIIVSLKGEHLDPEIVDIFLSELSRRSEEKEGDNGGKSP